MLEVYSRGSRIELQAQAIHEPRDALGRRRGCAVQGLFQTPSRRNTKGYGCSIGVLFLDISYPPDSPEVKPMRRYIKVHQCHAVLSSDRSTIYLFKLWDAKDYWLLQTWEVNGILSCIGNGTLHWRTTTKVT